jgi:FkbM family methyltransferase
MYQAHGWWFPQQDTHFAEMISKHISKGGDAVYQERVRRRSLTHCKNFGVALDIGANVGLWSQELCRVFQKVIAFEPVAQFRECLLRNVPVANLDTRACALGAQNTQINMIITEQNTGHSHVDTTSMGQGTIPMWQMDSLEMPAIDYIKIDCEGYEKNILLGAEQTVRRNRPIIVVEDKKHQDVGHTDTEGALELLQSWGASVLERVNNDVIVGWR